MLEVLVELTRKDESVETNLGDIITRNEWSAQSEESSQAADSKYKLTAQHYELVILNNRIDESFKMLKPKRHPTSSREVTVV